MPTVQEFWDNMDLRQTQELLGMRKKQTSEEYYQEQLAKASGIPTYEQANLAPRTEAQRQFAERCNLADKRMREYTEQVQAGREKFWGSIK